MIKSMTGYGRFEGVVEDKKILVEIKSVNHRYADYNIKVPRYFGYLEDKVRVYASEFINRGKVDIYVSMESFGEADKQVTLNAPLAENYIEVLRELRDTFSLRDDISVGSVARFSDIFLTERKEEDAEHIWALVKDALSQAMNDFVEMRKREGERMLADLRARSAFMLERVAEIETRSPQCVAEYRAKLRARIEEVLESTNIDEARILTEAAIYADKIAVDEETVRLRSHFDEMETILTSGEPAGRKLDFLIQEINREINTIGSKANDIEIAKIVVDLKAELEKLREQVQNIE